MSSESESEIAAHQKSNGDIEIDAAHSSKTPANRTAWNEAKIKDYDSSDQNMKVSRKGAADVQSRRSRTTDLKAKSYASDNESGNSFKAKQLRKSSRNRTKRKIQDVLSESDDSSDDSKRGGRNQALKAPASRATRRVAKEVSTIQEVADEHMTSSDNQHKSKSESSASQMVSDSNHSDPDAERFQFHKRSARNKVVAVNEDAYDHACAKLQLSAIPDVLPCRDEERQKIIDYIKNGLKNKGSSSSLYISGMPGTGKTATTMEVMRNLKKKYKFSFLSINAMALTNPNSVYTVIYESITGKKAAPAVAALFLDEFFKKRDKLKLLN